QAYPPKTVWTTCTTHCPANAVFFVHGHGGFVTDVVYVRERLVMLLWLGLFWSMLRRWRQTSPLQQRAFAPVFAAGVVLGLIHVSFIAYRELNGRTDLVVALSSAWTFSIVVFCAAILFGLSWRRRVLSRTLAHLGPALRETNAPAAVRDALAVALRD